MKIFSFNNLETTSPRLLFIGNLSLGSNAKSLLDGFGILDLEITSLDTSFYESGLKSILGRTFRKMSPKYYERLAVLLVGRKIGKLISEATFDYVFVFKGLYVSRQNLDRLSGLKIHYHPDDSSNPQNINETFTLAESSYDLHFTSKLHNIQEIEQRTGNRVEFIWYAYDEKLHRSEWSSPIDFSTAKVGFIGTRRPDRVKLVYQIASELGKNFMIAGLKWNRERNLKRLASVSGPVFGSDYLDFIHAAPIQLGFLNSQNRDTHTARTFEIPATGALFILQDSKEHRELFNHLEDVLLFRTETEIMTLLKWIQENPKSAAEIAKRGQIKVTSGNNTWSDRAAYIETILRGNSCCK